MAAPARQARRGFAREPAQRIARPARPKRRSASASARTAISPDSFDVVGERRLLVAAPLILQTYNLFVLAFGARNLFPAEEVDRNNMS